MHELLLKRITRRLENLPDAQGYQVLDYVEFLESRYGLGTRRDSAADRLTTAVEDSMRVARLPVAAIRGTMGAMDSAARLMERLAQAGKAAVHELGRSLAEVERADPPAEEREAEPGQSA